jgi:hypothetical protein
MITVRFRGKTLYALNDIQVWVYGLPVREAGGGWSIQKESGSLAGVDPDTVDQWTGWHDANNVDLYVNDVCKGLGIVRFWPEYGLFGFEHVGYGRAHDPSKPLGSTGSSTSYRPYTWKSYRPGKIQIIGNIHDDPTLGERR